MEAVYCWMTNRKPESKKHVHPRQGGYLTQEGRAPVTTSYIANDTFKNDIPQAFSTGLQRMTLYFMGRSKPENSLLQLQVEQLFYQSMQRMHRL
jgi:hypothetical protein